jgi:hypothetical protein
MTSRVYSPISDVTVSRDYFHAQMPSHRWENVADKQGLGPDSDSETLRV